ncbi:hypothetical protein V8C26DRAFT_79363 [Trichoderma gracile]
MPNGFSENRRTINVEAGQLPPPATKLIITQVLKASQDPPFWAWIIVGAFYDSEGRTFWSTELFAAHLDIRLESDEEQVSEAEAEADVETGVAPEPESSTEAEAEVELEDESEPESPPVQSPEVHRSVTPELQHPRPSAYNSRHIDAYERYNRPSPSNPHYLHRLYPHIHHYFSPHSYPHSHHSPPSPPHPHYHHHHHHHHNHRPSPHWFPAPPSINPPRAWDPALSGPVPGHWHASFDPLVGRWVHTWQPLPWITFP